MLLKIRGLNLSVWPSPHEKQTHRYPGVYSEANLLYVQRKLRAWIVAT